MDKFVREFIDIVSKNPDQPVVPIVDGEVCSEDYAQLRASFGTCRVGEIASFFGRCYTDRELFKEDYFCYHDDELLERFRYDPALQIKQNRERRNISKEEADANDAAEKALEEYLETIASRAFKRAILVYIDTPEDLEITPYEEVQQ